MSAVYGQPSNPKTVIGLIPCGGQAKRLGPLPLSKELYPIGVQTGPHQSPRPKVVSQYLLEQMANAGITRAYLILRPGKWDIPAYFGDGQCLGMSLAYLTMGQPYGVPFTLDQAYPFVPAATIAMGFPDIVLQPATVYRSLLARLAQSEAAVVLGLFPTDQPTRVGVVACDDRGRVQQIIEKPAQTDLRYMWAAAVWTPTFTQFMHDYLATIAPEFTPAGAPPGQSPRTEIPIGDVIQAAIAHGLPVEAECFAQGSYLDIGTPTDLFRAVQQFTHTPPAS